MSDNEIERLRWRVMTLESAAKYQAARATLTDEEREEVGRARDELLSGIDGYENEFANEKRRRAGVLDGILKRFV